MFNFLKRLFMFGDNKVKGEVVYGKLKDQVHPSYIPFSKNSGDKPVIATEQYVKYIAEDLQKQIDQGGHSGSISASNVSCPAMSPSGTSTNVEGILRELNARIYNIEKQMPHQD